MIVEFPARQYITWFV